MSTQPWWRPYSVAWIVVTYGQRSRVASAAAAPATSQSWPWTRSKRSRLPSWRPAACMCEFIPRPRRRTRRGRAASGPRARDARRPPRPSPTTAIAIDVAPAARQHVDLDARADQRLRELADVPREPARDDRRVLPRQDQDARAQGRAILPRRATSEPRRTLCDLARCGSRDLMSRLLTIALACLVLIGCAVGLVVVLGGSGDDGAEHGSAKHATSALRAARRRARRQPRGHARRAGATAPTRRNRGLDRGWADGDWRGREVTVPHSPNAKAHSGAAGRRAYDGSVGWYAREIDAPVRRALRAAASSPSTTARGCTSTASSCAATPARTSRSRRARCCDAGRHTVAVRVDWRDPARQADEDWQRAWFNYGGLHRPVTLARVGPSQLGALHVRTRLRRRRPRRASTSACACATA